MSQSTHQPQPNSDFPNRRTYLKRAMAAATVAAVANYPSLARAEDRYTNLKSDEYLGPVKTETEVEAEKIFTEGPAVDADGIVYFTNVAANRIMRWDPRKKKLSVFRENSNGSNGLYFDPHNNLIACEGDAGRVTKTDAKSGAISVLADKYNGFRFANPNDICMDAAGRLYFSSRPGTEDPSTGNVNAVYRLDPDGKVTQLLHWPDIHMPNGIVISPDNKTLYLIEAHPDADQHRDIRAYDLTPEGTLINERIHIDFYPGRSGDGMCIDSKGNLYVAAGLHKTRKTSETLDIKPGIHVISPQGKLLAFRETPVDTITNCTFGGPDLKTLYIACGPYLLSIRTTIAGKSTYKPAK
ncbi:MAG: gluconolactonase [Pirellulaceae bacterium]|jgi:gluconolactonase